MAHYIPFVGSDEAAAVVKKMYADAECARVSLDRWTQVGTQLKPMKLWIDPAIDGLDDLEARSWDGNPWRQFIKSFDGYRDIANTSFQAKPDKKIVGSFVQSVMAAC